MDLPAHDRGVRAPQRSRRPAPGAHRRRDGRLRSGTHRPRGGRLREISPHGQARRKPLPSRSRNAVLISARWVNACGKLPSCRPATRIELLAQQADVVPQVEQPLEQLACLVDAALHRQHVGEPERARPGRRPRPTGDRRPPRSVRVVAAQQSLVAQLPLGRPRPWTRTAGRRRAGSRPTASAARSRRAPSSRSTA